MLVIKALVTCPSAATPALVSPCPLKTITKGGDLCRKFTFIRRACLAATKRARPLAVWGCTTHGRTEVDGPKFLRDIIFIGKNREILQSSEDFFWPAGAPKPLNPKPGNQEKNSISLHETLLGMRSLQVGIGNEVLRSRLDSSKSANQHQVRWRRPVRLSSLSASSRHKSSAPLNDLEALRALKVGMAWHGKPNLLLRPRSSPCIHS